MTTDFDTYIAGLPKILASANTLFRSADGRVLLVEPNYRDDGTWTLPGGTIESDRGESPRQGARRETLEEIGLDVPPGALLAVDWVAGPRRPPLSLYLYDGGVLDRAATRRDPAPGGGAGLLAAGPGRGVGALPLPATAPAVSAPGWPRCWPAPGRPNWSTATRRTRWPRSRRGVEARRAGPSNGRPVRARWGRTRGRVPGRAGRARGSRRAARPAWAATTPRWRGPVRPGSTSGRRGCRRRRGRR